MSPRKETQTPHQNLPVRVARTSAAFALTACLAVSGAPLTAYANTQIDTLSESLNQAIQKAENPSYDPYSLPDGMTLVANTDFPSSFDLRYDWKDTDGVQHNIVTPVKNQTPWSTCWAFAAVAASESSLWADLYNAHNPLASKTPDLSERATAWFQECPVPQKYAHNQIDQNGETEGFHNNSKEPNDALSTGGIKLLAVMLYSQGVGPVNEAYAPYRNEENAIVVTLDEDDQAESDTPEYGSDIRIYTPEQIADMKPSEKSKLLYYAARLGETGYFGPDATWSLSANLWGLSNAELEEGCFLPEPRITDEDGNWQAVNWQGVDAIKSKLMEGRPVTINFAADTARPGEYSETKYLQVNDDGTWTHWTYERTSTTHDVAIVGWDDNFPKENFINGGPEADGAWIVKNSWGAQTEDFPNQSEWGTLDADGKNTGYFYLSYYDKSINSPVAYDFDISTYEEEPTRSMVDQYDYVPSLQRADVWNEKPTSMLNVFTAESDQAVRALSCYTTRPNTQVTYELYLIDSATDGSDGTMMESLDNAQLGLSNAVLRMTETYPYGGYHRVAISQGQQVALREGQRYAVKVTERNTSNGNAAYNINALIAHKDLTPEQKEQALQQFEESEREEMLQTFYQNVYDALIEEGVSEDQAQVIARAKAEELMELPTSQEQLREHIEEFENSLQRYCVTVVNRGESYVGTESADGQTEWNDWVDLMEPLHREDQSCDNLPIKAFANVADYADAQTLEDIAGLVEQAKAQLDAYAVSTDGSDVPKDKMWVTQEQRDALAHTIANAEALLAQAGKDFDVATLDTPSQEEADSMLAALQDATDAHRAQAKPGTMTDKAPEPSEASTPAAPAGQQPSATVATGDAAAPLTASTVALLAAASAAWLARKRKRRL